MTKFVLPVKRVVVFVNSNRKYAPGILRLYTRPLVFLLMSTLAHPRKQIGVHTHREEVRLTSNDRRRQQNDKVLIFQSLTCHVCFLTHLLLFKHTCTHILNFQGPRKNRLPYSVIGWFHTPLRLCFYDEQQTPDVEFGVKLTANRRAFDTSAHISVRCCFGQGFRIVGMFKFAGPLTLVILA